MERIQTAISYWHIFLGAITAEQWYVIGSILGASGLIIALIAWAKRRHLKQTADKLEDWVITVQLWFYSFILSIGSFILAVLGFGVNPDMFMSYFGHTWPYIVAFAPGLYTFSKAAKKKLAERKASKRHLSDELIDGIVDKPKATLTAEERKPIPAVSADIWAD